MVGHHVECDLGRRKACWEVLAAPEVDPRSITPRQRRSSATPPTRAEPSGCDSGTFGAATKLAPARGSRPTGARFVCSFKSGLVSFRPSATGGSRLLSRRRRVVRMPLCAGQLEPGPLVIQYPCPQGGVPGLADPTLGE